MPELDYELLRIERNKRNAFAQLVGIKVVAIGKGYARSELEAREELMNPVDSIHGGCLFTLADTTGGAAASSHGEHVTTVDGDIRYLRAGIGVRKVIAEAKELKKKIELS